jgi:CheY-like chemotaxis protein
MPRFMSAANDGSLILVVEDVEETRDGIEKLLKADGYRVDPAETNRPRSCELSASRLI